MKQSKEFEYSFHKKALKKWNLNNLQTINTNLNEFHFIFDYQGSTCRNGGFPYAVKINLVLLHIKNEYIISKCWVEIPKEHQINASKMCTYPGNNFNLLLNTGLEDSELEQAIRTKLPENFAGCFCAQPHKNQKLRIILETSHYNLNNNDSTHN